MKALCSNPFVADYVGILRRLQEGNWYRRGQLLPGEGKGKRNRSASNYLLRNGFLERRRISRWLHEYRLTESGHKFSMHLRRIFGDPIVQGGNNGKLA